MFRWLSIRAGSSSPVTLRMVTDRQLRWRVVGGVAGGNRGAAEITRFDAALARLALPAKSRARVGDYVDRKTARRMDRCAHRRCGGSSGRDGFGSRRWPPAPSASVWRSRARSAVESFQECVRRLAANGVDRVSPFAIVQTLPNLPAGSVSIELGAKGPLLAESTACAASNMAIGDARDAIRLGRADVMFCGGTEAPITSVAMAGFGAMRALSRRNGEPSRASRPFDASRDGFVMAEGAAVLVLEELEHATARGAHIYAEVVGYGVLRRQPCLGHRSTSENPARALRMAFADAGVEPGESAMSTRTELRRQWRCWGDTRPEARARRGNARRTRSVHQRRNGTHAQRRRAVEAVFTVLALPARRPAADRQLRDGGSELRSRLHRQRATPA